MPPNLPESFYALLGLMILANLGSIVAVFAASLKVVWWASKVDSRLEVLESDLDKVDELRSAVTELRVLVPHKSR